MSDSLLCASKLDYNDQITFKVELIDNQTNEILETLDEITYSKNNIVQYNNLGYQVNLSGIGERTVKLKLIVSINEEFGYSLSNRLSDQNSLAKDNYQVKDINSNISNVTEYALDQNYPNPFNPSTKIKFQLPKDGFVTLKVYDILGKEIVTLITEEKSQGKYEVNFNASSLSSGVYIYKLTAGNFTASKKLMLLK
ncbi:MAG: T9SS type A sorting domain-containing protein [Ignavibacteriaceae bacterium]